LRNNYNYFAGGNGGFVSADFKVTPGEDYWTVVMNKELQM